MSGIREDDGLKRKTAKGLVWGGIGNGAIQVLGLVFGIFLSRLLSPADYGIVGALTVFSALAGIFSESGFILAIVNRREVTKDDYNAVFWFNTVVCLFCYTVLFFAAPFIAGFYRQPEMTALSRFLFLSFVVGAFSATPVAYYMRNLMVKERSRIQIIAMIVSGAAGVSGAFLGWGYWSLALQTVLYSGINSALLWRGCPWRPEFSFRWKALRGLLPFSLKQLGVSVFNVINSNIFSVLLGYFYGMKITGFFTQGNKWTVMGYSTLNGMINSVGQPVLRQTVDDRVRTERVFRKMLRFASFVSFPAMFGLAIVSRELILIAITDKWIESVRVMQILCVGGAFMPLMTLYGNLFNSLGRPNVFMWNTIVLGLVQMGAMALTYRYGLNIMLAVYVGINVSWMLVWQYFARRCGIAGFRKALADILPYASLSLAVTGMAVWIAGGIGNLWISLIVKIAVAASLYIGLLWLFGSQMLKEAFAYFHK